MAQSQNSSVDLTIKATSFLGLASYGDLMIGNKALEYYNEKNVEDYIQIPWSEIDHVAASVMFGGKYISRFAVFTQRGITSELCVPCAPMFQTIVSYDPQPFSRLLGQA